MLRNGKHHANYLQNAWNLEEDKSVFDFQVFIYCKNDDLIKTEQSCLNFMNSDYNMSSVAGKIEMTEEVRKKISEANKGKPSLIGEDHPNFGKAPWNKGKTGLQVSPRKGKPGLSGPDSPRWGKPGAFKGKFGPEHNRFGKEPWNKGVSLPNQCGENNPNAALTQSEANEVRKLALSGEFKYREIAKMYGISVVLVGRIKRNEAYSIKGEE